MWRRTFVAASAASLAQPSVALPESRRVLKFFPQADFAIGDPVWTTVYVTPNYGSGAPEGVAIFWKVRRV